MTGANSGFDRGSRQHGAVSGSRRRRSVGLGTCQKRGRPIANDVPCWSYAKRTSLPNRGAHGRYRRPSDRGTAMPRLSGSITAEERLPRFDLGEASFQWHGTGTSRFLDQRRGFDLSFGSDGAGQVEAEEVGTGNDRGDFSQIGKRRLAGRGFA
jgi:hypothetical protein